MEVHAHTRCEARQDLEHVVHDVAAGASDVGRVDEEHIAGSEHVEHGEVDRLYRFGADLGAVVVLGPQTTEQSFWIRIDEGHLHRPIEKAVVDVECQRRGPTGADLDVVARSPQTQHAGERDPIGIAEPVVAPVIAPPLGRMLGKVDLGGERREAKESAS